MRPLAVLAILASVLAACSSDKDNEKPFVVNPPNPPPPQTQAPQQPAPPASRLDLAPSSGGSSMCPPAYYRGC